MSGAVAGVVSTVVFAGIHRLFIGDIWFFIVPMIVAGTICGVCVAGTFGLMTPVPTVRRWALFNATYVGLFVLLGIASVIIYEPVTTIRALIAMGAPPEALFREVLPLSVAFTLGGAIVLTWLFGDRWWQVGPALVTTAILVVFLGLNISILGLVEIPASATYLVAEVFGLIVAIVAVYAATFVALEWRLLASLTVRRRFTG